MADLEAVLADVSYLMAMERSKLPAAKTIKKLTLPDARLSNPVVRKFFLSHYSKSHSVHLGNVAIEWACT